MGDTRGVSAGALNRYFGGCKGEPLRSEGSRGRGFAPSQVGIFEFITLGHKARW